MKHIEILKQLTIEEKAAILTGKGEWQTRDIKRLGIPSIFCSDGPHGIRKQAGAGDHLGLNASLPATCFPTAATVANSWSRELGRAIGEALGEEAAAQEVDILLGPGLNIKRSPLCGRNFEYFSEDPYLAGKLAAEYIKGIQSKGVYACPKHFAVNSQELRRMAMNAVVDERTLREIYLTGFEIAVKEGNAKAIMSSYNQVNGEYANENQHLLKEVLREDWGFDGIVVTDWGGSNDHVKGVAMGSNLEMPTCGYESARELVDAIQHPEAGKYPLTEEELDACVEPLLRGIYELSEEREKRKEERAKGTDYEAHHLLARRAAEESTVLLKNKDDILPLKPGTKVALIGDFAFDPRYQGAGSSVVNAVKVENMSQMIGTYDVECTGMARGYLRTGESDEPLKRAALDLASTADVVLYCFGLNEISEAEGLDRNHMRIPQNQIDLLEDLVKVNENIIAIISAGSAIEMPWHYNCKGILHGYLSGQAGATAMLNILTGKVNPSGRLNETYPLKYEDTPAIRNFPSNERNAEYREGIFVGYRYYDTSKVRVLYPFGYGLSYTAFEYSDLEVTKEKAVFTLTNTGKMDGAEVAQLYIGCPKGKVFRPDRELKGFEKVFLKAGESKKVTIPLDSYAFRYWNTDTNGWETEGGDYEIMIGANVLDIRLSGIIAVEGSTEAVPYDKESLPSYYSGLIQNVTSQEFTRLLGYEIPSGKWSGRLTKNDAICQMYYAKSRFARKIYKILTNKKNVSEEKGKPDLNILFIYNMPFRGIAKMTGGMVSMEMVDGILIAVNGKFWRGLGKIMVSFVKNLVNNSRYKKKI